MEPYAYWFATTAAFLVSVFCALAEGALLSYSPSRLEQRLKDPRQRERVEAYLAKHDRYVFTAIVLNAVSDVVLVFACTLGFPGRPAYARWRPAAITPARSRAAVRCSAGAGTWAARSVTG